MNNKEVLDLIISKENERKNFKKNDNNIDFESIINSINNKNLKVESIIITYGEKKL